MPDVARPLANRILNSLPPDVLERLSPHLQALDTPQGMILHHAGDKIDNVYFPGHSIISVVAFEPNGRTVEVGVIGGDGMSGLEVLMGGESTPHQHIVQIADGGMRMPAAMAIEEFGRCTEFHQALLGFTRKMMLQISQTALCNRIHTADERLARWLLMCRDRVGSNELPLTQEFLSQMLGSDRVTVTHVAGKVQKLGYITYSRGKIHIIDVEGLKQFSCSCYERLKESGG